MPAKPIPDGYQSVTPYLIVGGAAKALDYYKRAFGAKERMRLPMPDGKIAHAEIEIGDSVIMLADEFPQMGAKSPQTIGGTPVGICPVCDPSGKTQNKAKKNLVARHRQRVGERRVGRALHLIRQSQYPGE